MLPPSLATHAPSPTMAFRPKQCRRSICSIGTKVESTTIPLITSALEPVAQEAVSAFEVRISDCTKIFACDPLSKYGGASTVNTVAGHFLGTICTTNDMLTFVSIDCGLTTRSQPVVYRVSAFRLVQAMKQIQLELTAGKEWTNVVLASQVWSLGARTHLSKLWAYCQPMLQ